MRETAVILLVCAVVLLWLTYQDVRRHTALQCEQTRAYFDSRRIRPPDSIVLACPARVDKRG